MRKIANLPEKGFDSFVQNSPSIESWRHSRSPKRVPSRLPLPGNQLRLHLLGACRFGGFLSVLTATFSAFENTLASCFVPKCWVGFLNLVRIMSLSECMPAVMTSLADFSHQLPGHHRFGVDVEHVLHSWAPWYRFHNFTLLCQTSNECPHQEVIDDVMVF